MNEKIWQILRIEKTKDKREITRAYRELLSATNPEDKPEEFKELRSAYEEALAYAEMPEEMKDADQKTDTWLKQLEDIYDDFSRRKDAAEWEKLFSDGLLATISGRMRAESELLGFLMDHYFIGHSVWLCMEEHFSFLTKKEELYENYPREFIDRVIVNGILYPDILPMELFVPGSDGQECQKYLDIYLQITPEDDCADKAEELKNCKESHPYGDALLCCRKIHFEDPKYIEELEEISRQHGDDLNLALMLGKEYLELKEYEKAEELCKVQLKIHGDVLRLKSHYADVLEAMGRYDDAVRQINEMMRMADGDNRILSELDQRRRQINVSIIADKEKQLEEKPDDEEIKIDLCWAYIENEKDEEGIALFRTVDEEKADAFNYYNLKSSMAYATKDYREGVEALKKVIEVIDTLPEDSEENIRRKKRKGEMYGRMGYFYYAMNDEENGNRAYEKAMEYSENKAETLTSLVQRSLMKEDFEKAEDYAGKLLQEKPDSPYGHALLAFARFYQNNDQGAYDAICQAIEMDGSDLSFYILKLRILIRNSAFEGAQQILDYLDACGLTKDTSVLYAKGLLAERRDGDKEKAKEYYRKSARQMEGFENNYEFADDLFYRLLSLEGETLNANVKEDRDRMMELAEKGLSVRPTNRDLLEYKGWLLIREKNYADALKIYLDLAKDEKHSAYVDSQVGYLYFQDLDHKAKESRDYYVRAQEKGYDEGADYYIGMCEMFMGHLEEAERRFLILQEKEPDSLDSYLRLTYVYEMKNELDKALKNADQLIDLVKERKDDVSRYYLRKVQILRRMEDPKAAIDVIKTIQEKYGYPGKKRIFDTYLQFGMFKEAEKMLWGWKWDGEYYESLATLELLKGKFRKAKQIMNTHSGGIDDHRCLTIMHLLALEEEDYGQEKKYLLKLLKLEEEKQYGDVSIVTGNLALNAFHQGDTQKQHMYAKRTLEEIDKALQVYRLNPTLYQSRKVRALALLGKRKEAEELAEKVRKMPLCDHCLYSSCKDLFVFEMEMAEIFGEEGKMHELAKQGSAKWPDEEDFVVALSRLDRKGRKKC